MGPWNSSSAVGHRLCSLPGLWRFPVAEASFQHQRQSHKSDFPWNHVKRTGAVTGYVYSLQRPFQPKLLRDITSGFKQNDLCQLFFRRSTWKAKIILKEHCLPEVLTLWDLISTLSLFWTAQSRYNLIHMTMQISRLPMNTEIYLTVSQSEDLLVSVLTGIPSGDENSFLLKGSMSGGFLKEGMATDSSLQGTSTRHFLRNSIAYVFVTETFIYRRQMKYILLCF